MLGVGTGSFMAGNLQHLNIPEIDESDLAINDDLYNEV